MITVLIWLAFGLFYSGVIEWTGNSFGTYCLDRSNYDVAFTSFGIALRANPKSIEALAGFGELHLLNSHFALAQIDYKTILTIDPQNAEAHCGLGIVAFKSGNIELAKNCFDKALKEQPDYQVAIDWRKKCE